MKLATLKNKTRDGQLVVVSNDLGRYVLADKIASTLQEAMDNWSTVAPALQALSDSMPTDAKVFDQADV